MPEEAPPPPQSKPPGSKFQRNRANRLPQVGSGLRPARIFIGPTTLLSPLRPNLHPAAMTATYPHRIALVQRYGSALKKFQTEGAPTNGAITREPGVLGHRSDEHPLVGRANSTRFRGCSCGEKKAHGLESTALPDHAAVCAQAAVEMLENLRSFNRRYQIDWAVRIGINGGPVIGGIIGKKIRLRPLGRDRKHRQQDGVTWPALADSGRRKHQEAIGRQVRDRRPGRDRNQKFRTDARIPPGQHQRCINPVLIGLFSRKADQKVNRSTGRPPEYARRKWSQLEVYRLRKSVPPNRGGLKPPLIAQPGSSVILAV